MDRKTIIERKTGETDITLEINLDGTGEHRISTGIALFDWMLAQIAEIASVDIALCAKGDINVDSHHTIEDTGIVLGKALGALFGLNNTERFGSAVIPAKDALALCSLDVLGESFLDFDVGFTAEKAAGFETETVVEFFRALCLNAGFDMHIKKIAGHNDRHIIEAVFKSFAKALGTAKTTKNAWGALPPNP